MTNFGEQFLPPENPNENKENELVNTKRITEIDNKQKAGQELSDDDLRFIYEMDNKIQGFGKDVDPRIEAIRQTRNIKEDAPLMFGCEPSEIAWSQAEVSENTKAYIGPLYPGIFQRDFEYIYTSFPERRIRKKQITIGDKSADQLEADLEKENVYFTVQDIFDKAKIVPLKKPEQMDIIILTVADLGFSQGATTKQIYARAKKLGLELCPAEVGPRLSLQYKDQPNGLHVTIAMKAIFGGDANNANEYLSYGSEVFHVDRFDDGQHILGTDFIGASGGNGMWDTESTWAFARRKKVK